MKKFLNVTGSILLVLGVSSCSYFDAGHYSSEIKKQELANNKDYQNCEVKLKGHQSKEVFKTTDLPGGTTEFHVCKKNNKILLMEAEYFDGKDPWSLKCKENKGRIFKKQYSVGWHQNGRVHDTVYADSYVCLVDGVVTSAINN